LKDPALEGDKKAAVLGTSEVESDIAAGELKLWRKSPFVGKEDSVEERCRLAGVALLIGDFRELKESVCMIGKFANNSNKRIGIWAEKVSVSGNVYLSVRI
jgi:hypothetical protein